MQIVTIPIANLMDPVELSDWFNAHPERTTDNTKIIVIQNLVYLIF